MQCLCWMQKDAVDTQAVHRGLDFPSNLSAFPHAAHNQLASAFDTVCDPNNRSHEPISRSLIRLVEELEVRQRCAFRRDNMDCP